MGNLKQPIVEHDHKAVLVVDPEEQQKQELSFAPIRKKKVAAYARVSTEQDAQQNSYEAQIEYYTGYIKSRSDWEFVDVYSDEGISGTSYKNRDGFNAMVADAKAGKIDLILTKSISRFARNTVDSLTITRDLKSHGVEVLFEKENISSMDPRAELIFTIMSSIAQEESRSISENVRWGKQRSMEAGKVSLAWSTFLGYAKGPDGFPVIVEEEAQIIRRIYHLFLEGNTFHEIARILTKDGIKTPMGKDKWKPETVRSILTNEKYKGSALLQKTFVSDFLTKKVVVNNGQRKQWYVEDSHDAIITPEIFELVQQEIARRCGRQGRYYDSPFTGKLKCAICGELYGHRKWHSDRASATEIWVCINKYKKGAGCLSGNISEDDIKKAFLLVSNRLFANRTKYGRAYEEEILPRLCDASEQKQAIAALIKEIEQCQAEAEALNAENSKKPQSDEGFIERIKSLDKLIGEKKQEILKNRCLISERLARKEKIRMFLTYLDKTGPGFKEFDIPTWHALVDYVEVAPKILTFRLNDGTEEKVKL